jgi:protease II
MINKVGARLNETKKFESFSIGSRIGEYYYFDHTKAGADYSIHYRTKRGIDFMSQKDVLDGAEEFFNPKRDLKDMKT